MKGQTDKSHPALLLFYLTVLISIMIYVSDMIIEYTLELLYRENRINFSYKILVLLFSLPLLNYAFPACLYSFFFGKWPKYNNFIIKWLARLMFGAIVFCLPLSFYVNYTLLNEGYRLCDRTSWLSPTNTYVTDKALCKGWHSGRTQH
jgi:hypothetical protein